MSKQALVDHAVKQCYQEYAAGRRKVKLSGDSHVTAKSYTVAWFSVWWGDVSLVQLTRAIEKAEALNAVQA